MIAPSRYLILAQAGEEDEDTDGKEVLPTEPESNELISVESTDTMGSVLDQTKNSRKGSKQDKVGTRLLLPRASKTLSKPLADSNAQNTKNHNSSL